MKSYFIRLFNYDQFANRQITQLILSSPPASVATQLIAHILAAQQRWLIRCQAQPQNNDPLWPNWPAKELETIINANHQNWINYLQTLQPADMERVITYQNMQGITYSDTLQDIIAHVINHGTHHRAQAGQQLKQASVALPVSDYIFFAREFDKTT